MARIRLFMLKGNVAPLVVVNDAEHLKALPTEKMTDFFKWVVRFRTNRENYTEEEWKKLADAFKFKSVDGLIGTQRIASILFYDGACVSKADLESDLKSLGFEHERIILILNILENLWRESEDYLTRTRDEAIPVLSSLRWRVDVRHASSEYLRKPEIVALLRIVASDKEETTHMYVELDEDKLSWLETVIGKVKREMLKAKETLGA